MSRRCELVDHILKLCSKSSGREIIAVCAYMMTVLTHTFVPGACIWFVDGVHSLMHMPHFLIVLGVHEMQRR